ncbi:MAG TPA: MFS transporter [Burkholderiales bacterium]
MATPDNRRAVLILLLVSGTIISLCMGMRQSLGLFMRPVTLDLGVSVGTFGFALALQNMVWGLSQPFVGAIADRYGARPVVVATALSYVAGLLLMAYARSAVALDLAGLLVGIGIAGTSFGVLIGVVARATPPEKRSQTVGLIAAVGSLGTVVLAPVAQWLLDGFGWRMALVAFAAIAGVMVLLAFAIREPAHVADAQAPVIPQKIGEALREAGSHRGFMAMTVAYFACGFQLIFITTHLPQYLELCGVSPAVGAQALALIGLFNTFGTWMFGQLGARYSQKKLLAFIYLFRTLFIALFVTLPVTGTTTLIFAAAMGFLWLGVAPLVTVLIGRVLGLAHFNMLYGIVFLSHQVGSFCGAWLGGVAFDLTGSYNTGWASLLFIGALAFTLQWTMDDRPPTRRQPQPDPVPAPA